MAIFLEPMVGFQLYLNDGSTYCFGLEWSLHYLMGFQVYN